jgi:hypothetical protein
VVDLARAPLLIAIRRMLPPVASRRRRWARLA